MPLNVKRRVVLLFKSYVKEHKRRLKNGTVVIVPAHYDKRVRKGTEHAPDHGHNLNHLDAAGKDRFNRMHAEQHMLHHYHGHALRQKVSEQQARVDALAKQADEHRQAGRHTEAAAAENKRWRANAAKLRTEKELADVEHRVKAIGAMKEAMVQGAGKVDDSTDETHQRYAGKLGARFKTKQPVRKPAKPQFIEHVTKKGKTLRGVIRTDLTRDEANAIDPYTFRKEGGYFIREKYLDAAQGQFGSAQPAAHGTKPRVLLRNKEVTPKQQASKLRDVANRLLDRAKEDMGRERLANTPRRARMAAGAEDRAAYDEMIAKTMHNIADAIESGEAKHLSGVTSKAAVETLDSSLRSATYSRLRAEKRNYIDREPEMEDVKHAELPLATWDDGNRNRLVDALGKVAGTKGLIQRIHRSNALDAEIIAGVKKKLPKSEVSYLLGAHMMDIVARRERFARMGIKSNNDLRAALTEYLEHRSGKREKDPVKEAERALVGKKVGIDFFPTPKPLAAKMVEMAGIKPGMTVLEPSAGNGHLADAARDAGAKVDTVELSNTLRDVLQAKGHTIVAHDFDAFEPGKQYDAVIMNPPFSGRRDAMHVQRAYSMIKPGGTLVAITGEGVHFGSDKKASAFREWLDENGAEVEKLPENTFKGINLPAQTGVNARMIVMHKPSGAGEGASTGKGDAGPKDGDTKTENGKTYRLINGRWHLVTDDLSLTQQTASDVAKQEAERKAKAEADAKRRKADADRAQADRERGDFTLAGSDRDIDQMAARGQTDMLGGLDQPSPRQRAAAEKPAPPKKTAPIDDADNPNSPNYRYRDTGIIAGARKFDVANQFRNARKAGQRLRSTDIDWEEVEANPRQARELITKSNLFGQVDWDHLKTTGMEPGAGFLVDRVYASIDKEPGEDSLLSRKDYALGIETVRDRLESCKTPDEVEKTLREMRDEYRGEMLSAKDAPAYQAAMAEYNAAHKKLREAEEQAEAMHKPVFNAQLKVSQLEYEQSKYSRRRNGRRSPELDEQIAAAKAEHEKLLESYMEFRKANGLEMALRDVGDGKTAYTSDLKWAKEQAWRKAQSIMKIAQAKNILNNPTTRAWIALGPRFHAILTGKSDAYAGHRANVRMGKVKDWSWADKGAKAGKAPLKRDARFQLQVADEIERHGGKPVKAESTQALKDAFRLRDVQSGNWVLKDPGSAQWHVERAAEAFTDLADLVGARPEQIGINGRLALAFGARGKGNSGFGGAARAHYEAVERVINITKMKGGGTLAHEWFHSLDNLLAEMHGGTSGKGVYATEGARENLPPAVADAFATLHDVMHAGKLRATRKIEITDRERHIAEYNLGSRSGATTIPGLPNQIVQAGNLQAAIDAIGDSENAAIGHKQKYGKRWTKKDAEKYENWRKIAAAHYTPEGTTEVSVSSGAPMSLFALEAKKLDGGRDNFYWSRPREMAARAFQAWAEDRLAGQQRRNDYLSAKADNKYYIDPIFGPMKPFPEGDERERINQAFDELFAAMRAHDTFAKAFGRLARRPRGPVLVFRRRAA